MEVAAAVRALAAAALIAVGATAALVMRRLSERCRQDAGQRSRGAGQQPPARGVTLFELDVDAVNSAGATSVMRDTEWPTALLACRRTAAFDLLAARAYPRHALQGVAALAPGGAACRLVVDAPEAWTALSKRLDMDRGAFGLGWVIEAGASLTLRPDGRPLLKAGSTSLAGGDAGGARAAADAMLRGGACTVAVFS